MINICIYIFTCLHPCEKKLFIGNYRSPTVEEHIFFKKTVLQRAIKLALSTAGVFTLYYIDRDRIISSVFYLSHVNCEMCKVVFFPPPRLTKRL